MLIDLHVHSHLSRDCPLSPAAILKRAEAVGLDGIAFTETNTQDGYDELLEIGETSKVHVFVGLELATDRGQYLCFFERPDRAPEPVQMFGSNREKAWEAAICLPKLKALGAVIVAARPYDRDYPTPARDSIKSMPWISAIEVYNPKVRLGANESAVMTATALQLPGVAGSDTKVSLDELGTAATMFLEKPKTQAEFVAALRASAYYPVQMGKLPPLMAPGEAMQDDARKAKSAKRKWRIRRTS